MQTNMLVSPAYMAKGLEFDAVISYNDKSHPYGEEDNLDFETSFDTSDSQVEEN